MNQKQLIKETASRSGISERQVRNMLAGLVEIISETLCKDESVNLYGFGKFYTAEYKARDSKTPQGEPIRIEARKIPRFKPSKALKERCL